MRDSVASTCSLLLIFLLILSSSSAADAAFAPSRPWGRGSVAARTERDCDARLTPQPGRFQGEGAIAAGEEGVRRKTAITILGSSRRRRSDDDEKGGDGYDDDGEDGRYEYARVGRRRRGYKGQEMGGDDDKVYDTTGRDRRGSQGEYLDDDDDYYYDDDYEEEEEEEEFEEGILVPNPILDAIDPEGAAERIPELFADPKWWRDAAAITAVVLFVYLYTFDASDLVPWDSVTPDDFNLRDMYVK